MNLKASMKKLEPSGLDLLDQMLVIINFSDIDFIGGHTQSLLVARCMIQQSESLQRGP